MNVYKTNLRKARLKCTFVLKKMKENQRNLLSLLITIGIMLRRGGDGGASIIQNELSVY
jgi:hypothetical protein